MINFRTPHASICSCRYYISAHLQWPWQLIHFLNQTDFKFTNNVIKWQFFHTKTTGRVICTNILKSCEQHSDRPTNQPCKLSTSDRRQNSGYYAANNCSLISSTSPTGSPTTSSITYLYDSAPTINWTPIMWKYSIVAIIGVTKLYARLAQCGAKVNTWLAL